MQVLSIIYDGKWVSISERVPKKEGTVVMGNEMIAVRKTIGGVYALIIEN